MIPRKIRPGVFSIGANHGDRELFDELIPLPDGTSYNSYLVKGTEKTALIDTVDPCKKDILLKNLESMGVEELDYLIANHAEQDHSGSIPFVLERYPGAKVVVSIKGKGMVADLLAIEEGAFLVVKDGDELSLGNKTLEFIYTPWVHWPETMSTYLREDKVLFPGDFFGSHLATSNLFVEDERKVYLAAKRYYAEIMMPFRAVIRKNLEKLSSFDIDVIAASHGPIFDKPEFIIDAYKEWSSELSLNEVVIPYVSMHGSTEKMVEYFIDRLIERGIKVKPYNLTATDLGQLAMALVDASTIVIAAPTVLTGPHPAAVYAACLANALRPKLKFAGIIGSYGWGSRMVDILKGLIGNLKVDLFEPVLAKGLPDENNYKALEQLADQIDTAHQDSELVTI